MSLLVLSLALCGQADHGSLLPTGEIREAIQELREVRKANQEVAAESREWRGLFSRFDGSRLEKFADRIGTLVWLCFWALIVGGVAYCLRQVADVLKAFRDVFRKPEAKE